MAPRLLTRALIVSMVLQLLAASTLVVAETSNRRAISRVTREFAARRLHDANELLAAQNYEKALARLQQIETSRRVSDYERALAYQGMGFVYSAMGKYERSVRAFESIRPGVLERGSELNVVYNLGQLYVALGRTDDAIEALERWFGAAENPSPHAHITLANAYLQADRYADALPLVERACKAASSPPESWLRLLVSLNVELSQLDRAIAVLERLVARYPRKSYWMQLSGLYGEVGRDRDALTAVELADIQAPLRDADDLNYLVHSLLHHGIPYKAARIVERGLSTGTLDDDWRNHDLLASSLLQAREVERAIDPLTRAASKSTDGNLWFKLAQLRVQREEWKEARTALHRAQERGGLDHPGMAALLAGIANLNLGERDLAREAFQQARGFSESRRSAIDYVEYLTQLERTSRAE